MTANRRNWDRSVTVGLTGRPREPAQYDPNLPTETIKKMEMECIRVGKEGGGQLIQDRCHKRTYWKEMGQVIGASAGEKTCFIFVEYHNSGQVHGRPITWKELRDGKKVRE
jgi:hypothetical protein